MKIDLTDEEINWLYQAMDCHYNLLPYNGDWFNDSIPEVIKQKFIATFKMDYDIMRSRAHKYCEENCFADHNLFLGNGIHSANEASMLHKRLAYATMMLGGLQQSGRPETKEQAEREELYLKEGEQKIKTALKDIIAAFGYKPEELNDT